MFYTSSNTSVELDDPVHHLNYFFKKLIELISEEALLIFGFFFLLLLVWVLDHSWCSTVLTVGELLMTLLEIM